MYGNVGECAIIEIYGCDQENFLDRDAVFVYIRSLWERALCVSTRPRCGARNFSLALVACSWYDRSLYEGVALAVRAGDRKITENRKFWSRSFFDCGDRLSMVGCSVLRGGGPENRPFLRVSKSSRDGEFSGGASGFRCYSDRC